MRKWMMVAPVALVGWDLLGFHSKSGFTSSGYNDMDGDLKVELIYDPVNGVAGSAGNWVETGDENVKARKGPFLELENANVYAMGDIYTDTTGFDPLNFLLCDEYAVKRFAVLARRRDGRLRLNGGQTASITPRWVFARRLRATKA